MQVKQICLLVICLPFFSIPPSKLYSSRVDKPSEVEKKITFYRDERKKVQSV